MFEVLAEGLALPEGPVVMPDGSIICVELLGGRVTRVWGAGKKEVVATLGGGPNGAQLGPDGALYVCNNGGVDPTDKHCADAKALGRIERVDLMTGRFDRICDHLDGIPLGAPNDLVITTSGGIWFTDHGKTLKTAYCRGAIGYCLIDGGGAKLVHYGGLTYNGIALSPDGGTLYFATTFNARLYRMAIVGPGSIARSDDGVEMVYVCTAIGDVGLDSMAVTQAGNICVGTLGTGGITTFTPYGHASFLPLPDPMVTNIAFGGLDMCDAYITLGRSGRLIKMRWPEPGLPLSGQ